MPKDERPTWAGQRTDEERIEDAKQALRLEETMPEADRCPECAEARRQSGDPTDLCPPHLARVLGLQK
jgi:hypothetical protein